MTQMGVPVHTLVRDDDEYCRGAISSDTEGVEQGSPEMKPTGGKLAHSTVLLTSEYNVG